MADANREGDPIVIAIETLVKAGVELFVPGGGAAVVIWEALRGQIGNRVGRTFEEVLAEVPADALISKISESSEFEALVALALESAGRTGYEPKRLLLGRVIINAASDQAQVDPSLVLAYVLRDIDAPHIRALERVRLAQDNMTLTRDEQAQVDQEPEAERSVRWHAVRRAGGEAAAREPEAVRAVLVRTALAASSGMSFGSNITPVDHVTDFGRELLDHLRVGVGEDATLLG